MIVMVNLLVDILYALIDPASAWKADGHDCHHPITTDTVAASAPFWRLKGFPVIPVSILVFIAFVAGFRRRAGAARPADRQPGTTLSSRRSGEGGSLAYPLAPTMSAATCSRA